MSNALDIRCPRCQSKQLSTAEKSSGRLTLTCLACGNSFKATDSDATPQKVTDKPPPASVGHAPAKTRNTVPDSEALDQKIIEIARTAGKLAAVKYCYDQTGWSLKKCKDYVDQLAPEGPVDDASMITHSEPEPSPGLDILAERVIEIARTRGKLHAVKYYRDRTGKGLKESLEYIDRYVPAGAIKKIDGCFIATACYGSYEAEEVLVLRRFRDTILQPSAAGRLVIHIYYKISPPLARFIGGKKMLTDIVRRCLLQPLVKMLSQNVKRP